MTLRVLCVDDEPDILLVLDLALRHTIGADVLDAVSAFVDDLSARFPPAGSV